MCGRVIGVQFGEPNAFRPYFKNRELTLEDPFVDGVILLVKVEIIGALVIRVKHVMKCNSHPTISIC